MKPRTIVIGDIHGCLQALDAILAAIRPQPNDTLVTVGDYVDRGPDSKGVIERLLSLREQVHLVPLLGNHEEMMLDALEKRIEPFGWLNHGGAQTLESYGFTGDTNVVPETHLELLRNLQTYFENDTHFVVHANYDPRLPLAEQPTELLRWVKLTERMPGPHVSGKIAVVGHTHDRQGEILKLPHLICLDTYCYGGRWLTAMDLDSQMVWQATREGELVTSS
jgi:serine/threonine protein phosphatase 1